MFEPEIKEQLTKVSQMLTEGRGEEIWSVLSALRGPDFTTQTLSRETEGRITEVLGLPAIYNTNSIKSATIGVIRYRLFKLARPAIDPTGNDLGAYWCMDTDFHRQIREILRRASHTTDTHLDHFLSHAEAAFLTLGMEWDKVNEG
jgi:hypothetical protein